MGWRSERIYYFSRALGEDVLTKGSEAFSRAQSVWDDEFISELD